MELKEIEILEQIFNKKYASFYANDETPMARRDNIEWRDYLKSLGAETNYEKQRNSNCEDWLVEHINSGKHLVVIRHFINGSSRVVIPSDLAQKIIVLGYLP